MTQEEVLLHRLGLHTWYQGDDGFGGEYEVDPKDIEIVENWLQDLWDARKGCPEVELF